MPVGDIVSSMREALAPPPEPESVTNTPATIKEAVLNGRGQVNRG